MIAEARPTLPTDLAAIDTIIAGKRPEADVYPTPNWAVEQILNAALLSPYHRLRILDPGAGSGVWGAIASSTIRSEVWGVELRDLGEPLAEFDQWFGGTDYLKWLPSSDLFGNERRFDLIIGNPPYSLAEEFIRHSFDLLAPGGQVIFLLRLAFLEGQARAKGLWVECQPERVLVLPKRPSFSGNGKTDAVAYAAFYWRQGFKGTPALGWL